MTFVVCTLAVFLLSLTCLWHCIAASPSRRRVVLVASVVAVGWSLACVGLGVDGLGALLVLHEGGTVRTLRSLFGDDDHAGVLWREGLRWLSGGDVPTMVWVAKLNAIFAGLTLVAVTLASFVTTRSVLGAVVALALLVASNGFWTGVLSETPAPALWFVVLCAAPAWHLLTEVPQRPTLQRDVALLSWGSCAVMAIGLREEFALVALPLLGVALALRFPGAAWVDRAWGGLTGAAQRLRASHWSVRLMVLAVVLALPRLDYPDLSIRLVVVALLPSPELLRLPLAVSSVVPLPVVALATVGVVSSVGRGPLRTISAFVSTQLFAVYFVACHDVGWEMLRYGTMAAGLLWLFALVGWAVVERYAERAVWRPGWRVTGALLAVLLSLGIGPSHPGWWSASARGQGFVVRQTKQREASALVRAVVRDPDCVFVARVRSDGRHGPMVLATFGYTARLRVHESPAARLEDLDLRTAVCVRYFRTLDCNGAGGARCDEDTRGATPLGITTERWATYSDPDEYGLLAPVVTYGIWRVAVDTAMASH